MVKVRPHFKVHVSLPNHEKTAALYQDKELLGIYTSIGIEAISAYAAKNDNILNIPFSRIKTLTGHERIDKALLKLSLVCSKCPLSYVVKDGYVSLTFPNLAKKHGMSKSMIPHKTVNDPLREKKEEEDKDKDSGEPPNPQGSDPSEPPPKKPKPQPSAFDVDTAQLLSERIRIANPNSKIITASGKKSWADICRKMRTSDSLSEAQIRYALEWVFSKANTEAECPFVVLCMKTLRQKWNPIVARIQKLKDAPENRTASPATDVVEATRRDRIRMVGGDIINTLIAIEGDGMYGGVKEQQIKNLYDYKAEFLSIGGEISNETHARMQKIFGMA